MTKIRSRPLRALFRHLRPLCKTPKIREHYDLAQAGYQVYIESPTQGALLTFLRELRYVLLLSKHRRINSFDDAIDAVQTMDWHTFYKCLYHVRTIRSNHACAA